MSKPATAVLKGLNKKNLRRWLMVFFLALLIPSAVLVQQAFMRLELEAFHQYQSLAEELSQRIDLRFSELLSEEEKRAFTDYVFLNIAGDPAASFLQRSPLSAYPPESNIPGLIGYFQVDAQGALLTPLLPDDITQANRYGIPEQELLQRQRLHNTIQQILVNNRLLHTAPGRRRQAKVLHQKIAGDARDDNLAQNQSMDETSRLDRNKKTIEHKHQNSAATQSATRLAQPQAPAIAAQELISPEQSDFDQLKQAAPENQQTHKQQALKTLGRVADLNLDKRYQNTQTRPKRPLSPALEKAEASREKRSRKELNTLPESIADKPTGLAAPPTSARHPNLNAVQSSLPAKSSSIRQTPARIRIHTFESEIDPFKFNLLDDKHFVLFRTVWRNQQRIIQGMLLDRQLFLDGIIQSLFQPFILASTSDLLVAYRGDVFSLYHGQPADDYLSSTDNLQGSLLYQTKLSAPFNQLELIFSVNQLPAAPGATLVGWTAIILLLILSSGLYLIQRSIAKQIELTEQQQDFVSAVSHELKTPLTSIRMYSEILRQGWASEDKQRLYHNYIFDESERLSRLINNILQLARLTRNQQPGDLNPHPVSELLDMIQSKIATQAQHSGFTLKINCETAARHATILADPDWFSQIFINLADNAIKFSRHAQQKTIVINCKQTTDNTIQFSVRDYGQGIQQHTINKIFELFYRTEDEKTRETVGTGIGLALVQQLTQAMNATIEVINGSPGAEFRICFPIVSAQ